MSNVSQVPPTTPQPRDVREARAKSNLRQSVWEATQYMEFVDVREYVEGVLVVPTRSFSLPKAS